MFFLWLSVMHSHDSEANLIPNHLHKRSRKLKITRTLLESSNAENAVCLSCFRRDTCFQHTKVCNADLLRIHCGHIETSIKKNEELDKR